MPDVKISELHHDDPTPIEEAIRGVLGHDHFLFVVLEARDGTNILHTPANETAVTLIKLLGASRPIGARGACTHEPLVRIVGGSAQWSDEP